MGLLSQGTPLPWQEAKKYSDHVRKHGIIQFLNIWNRVKIRRRDMLLWGDEIEYVVVQLDTQKKKAFLCLTAHDALEKLEKMEKEAEIKGIPFEGVWHPEYGRYMLESTPSKPYGPTFDEILKVEENMAQRRKKAQSVLGSDQLILSMTVFPHLGVRDFLYPPNHQPTPADGASRSLYIPDIAMNPHARFPTLTRNIRERRQSKVCINVPVYKDTNTQRPFLEELPESVKVLTKEQIEDLKKWSSSNGQAGVENTNDFRLLKDVVPDSKPDHIYLDGMCFGMGCCCLQITFQACAVEEARQLYDQLAVMSPIMLALSAAAPIFKGVLADVDCRWDVISGSVDDRTKEERGELPLHDNRFRISKSRYESISQYLSPGPLYSGGCCYNIEVDETTKTKKIRNDYYKEQYNDIELVYDHDIYEELMENGVDHLLAKHYAHLFIRDPLVIYKELLNQDDTASSDHFENIQSTNWQTMRFKPPPPTAHNMGWRVEFRSMEVQRTDFENASFAIFVLLLTRAILSLGINFYIPLSKVDENMKNAQKRDAVLNETFWFRNHIDGSLKDDSYSLMSCDEIMNGNDRFPGVITLVREYVQKMGVELSVYQKIDRYIQEISDRASGKKKTNARQIRDLVHSHPAYKHDSVVTDEVVYDIVKWYAEFN